MTDEKEYLWWMCTDKSPEAETAFVHHVLSGLINIPQELVVRYRGSANDTLQQHNALLRRLLREARDEYLAMRANWTQEPIENGLAEIKHWDEALAKYDAAVKTDVDGVTVGKYTIKDKNAPRSRDSSIWIEHESGEGSEFEISQLEAAVERFYKEHF